MSMIPAATKKVQLRTPRAGLLPRKEIGDALAIGLHWVGPYMRIVLCPVPCEYINQLHMYGAPKMDVEYIKYPPDRLDKE
ncbi:hypothetical protein HK104_004097 [Borealophlyctis nickersoniae]|nr:hypothetical protein HK104_004097 [Borealophlyctis nickersoniae]